MTNIAANAPVALPPSITGSKSYRCKDNKLIYIDWMSDGTRAREEQARGSRNDCHSGRRAQGRQHRQVGHLQRSGLQQLSERRSNRTASPRGAARLARGFSHLRLALSGPAWTFSTPPASPLTSSPSTASRPTNMTASSTPSAASRTSSSSASSRSCGRNIAATKARAST